MESRKKKKKHQPFITYMYKLHLMQQINCKKKKINMKVKNNPELMFDIHDYYGIQ